MRLLDLVEQYHRIGLAPYGLGKLAALVVADVSRRRSDEPRHAVPFLIFAHVDARQHLVVVEEELGERFGQLGLADARRAEEDERSDRLARVVQSGARTAHSVRNGGDGLLLSHDALVKLRLHVQQFLTLRGEHPRHGDARPARYDLGHILRIDLLLDHGAAAGRRLELGLQGLDLLLRFDDFAVAQLRYAAIIALTLGLLRLDLVTLDVVLLLLNLGQQVALTLPLGAHSGVARPQLFDLLGERRDALFVVLAANRLALDLQLPDAAVEVVDLLRHGVHLESQPRSRLVDQIDRLVGQEPRGNVPVRQLHGGNDRLVLDAHLMVILIAILQPAQDRDGIVGGRLVDHHLLETAFERLVLLEVFLKLVERRRADRAQFAACEGRFEDVGRIHRTRRLAGAHQRVNFVDKEQNLALRGDHLLHDGFQTLLEFALILRAGDQCAHVEREDHLRFQVFGHVAVDDPVGDSLGDGRLADTRLAHENRVVLRTARKDLQHAPDLLVAADHRIELAVARLLVEVDRVLAQRVELLRRGLRIDGRPLAEGADRFDQLLFGSPRTLQQIGRRTALGDQSEQQVLDRRVLVAEILREVHRTLDDARRILREILLAVAARNLRQRAYGAIGLVTQAAHVDPHTPQQERTERVIVAHEHRKKVHRLHGLLPALLRQRISGLQRLLCFDC